MYISLGIYLSAGESESERRPARKREQGMNRPFSAALAVILTVGLFSKECTHVHGSDAGRNVGKAAHCLSCSTQQASVGDDSRKTSEDQITLVQGEDVTLSRNGTRLLPALRRRDTRPLLRLLSSEERQGSRRDRRADRNSRSRAGGLFENATRRLNSMRESLQSRRKEKQPGPLRSRIQALFEKRAARVRKSEARRRIDPEDTDTPMELAPLARRNEPQRFYRHHA
jgi:hypothetical protein